MVLVTRIWTCHEMNLYCPYSYDPEFFRFTLVTVTVSKENNGFPGWVHFYHKMTHLIILIVFGPFFQGLSLVLL